jgi:hypothetical protein
MSRGCFLMLEALNTSETSVNAYQSVRHNIPKDVRLRNMQVAWADTHVSRGIQTWDSSVCEAEVCDRTWFNHRCQLQQILNWRWQWKEFRKFEIPTATVMKISVFWNVAPCRRLHNDRLIILMEEAVRSSETSVVDCMVQYSRMQPSSYFGKTFELRGLPWL